MTKDAPNHSHSTSTSPETTQKVRLGCFAYAGIFIASWLFVCLCFAAYATITNDFSATNNKSGFVVTFTIILATIITIVLEKRKKRRIMQEHKEQDTPHK